MNEPTASGDSSSATQTAPPKPTPKKKRNLPGMPDPNAEVIALSPKTLLATNRFVCEICNKGFQRDQNLQLHKRGHNLPWKLTQRTSAEVKKRVYVCPEPGCVHHDPSRALGDLTGIKKHFCRKHGEKKWKCDRCSKKYAVQSDWKAHSKVCGTREHKCGCGTTFSRRDSFVNHRAFCNALAEECAEPQLVTKLPGVDRSPKIEAVVSSPTPPVESPPPQLPPYSLPSPSPEVHPIGVVTSSSPDENHETPFLESPNLNFTRITDEVKPSVTKPMSNCSTNDGGSTNTGSSCSNTFATLFASSTSSRNFQSEATPFTDLLQSGPQPYWVPSSFASSSEPVSLRLSMDQGLLNFVPPSQYAASPPTLSATALLQKAAQVGPTTSNASLLRGLRIEEQIECDDNVDLGLGMACDANGSGLKELMMGTQSVFGPKHITLDLLGLGMAAGGSSSGGLSAFVTSMNAAGPKPFGGHDMR